MVKRIEKDQVRIGMFIESLEGSWQENPFEERRFLLAREADVEKLKSSNVTGIFINTAKGVDASGATRTFSRTSPAKANPAEFDQAKGRRATATTLQLSVQRLESEFRTAQAGGTINIDNVSSIVGDISKQIEDSPAILLDMTRLKSKDKVTFIHSVAVSALLVHFARHLKFEEPLVRVLGIAGLVHDIGKLAIPTEILNKTSALNVNERNVVMQHPAIGHDLLVRQGGLPQIVLDICRHHHERMDGKGYPDGLPAGDLSIFVRMSAICDVYEAVTSIRPYKKPWSSAQALSHMLDRPEQFDHSLMWKFVLSLDSELTKGVA